MQSATQKYCYYGMVASLLLLVALCIAWELVLAPLRPGGSWLVLKVLPLLVPLRGLLKRDVYTMQWSSMLILVYVGEGVVRATSDRGNSALLAWGEVGLTGVFFACIVMYLYPYKKAAKRLAQQAIHKASNKAPH
ncbi:MAG: DUF2069 domain-containing protein [Burkholderiaceae bacterium]